jgi:hypothetical protein
MVEVLFGLLDKKGASSITNGTNGKAAAARLLTPPSPPLPPRRANPLAHVPLLTRAAAMADGLARGFLGPLIPADPPSALKAANHRRVAPERRCATSERISLAEVPPCTPRRPFWRTADPARTGRRQVKALRGRLPGLTVNDVFAALLTVCVRKALEAAHDPLLRRPASARRLRATFPVNLRTEVACGWAGPSCPAPVRVEVGGR